MMMMTRAATSSDAKTTGVMEIVFVALMGAGILFIAGFAHSQTLHDAAHDMRHTSGFPCH